MIVVTSVDWAILIMLFAKNRTQSISRSRVHAQPTGSYIEIVLLSTLRTRITRLKLVNATRNKVHIKN